MSSAQKFRLLREPDMKAFEVENVGVSLVSSEDGTDRIAVTLADGPGNAMVLTPAQARALATELITAVNRAEVKASLRTSPNLWRRAGNAQPQPAEAPAYPGESRPRLATAG
jgi:hypothetical protein